MGTCNTAGMVIPRQQAAGQCPERQQKKAPQSLTLPDILKIAKV